LLILLIRPSFISELTEADIESAMTPIHLIVFAVSLISFYHFYFNLHFYYYLIKDV
jgi:hypothetical protein